MKILFNASVCGLGNNGGSKTIIRSAATLNKLGHTATIITNVDNYTWSRDHLDYTVILGNDKPINNYDTIVNVSVWDVDNTLKSPIKNKIWWVRGIEKWVYGEKYFFDKIKLFAQHGKIIVNSSWMIDYIYTKTGIKPELCFSGLDLGIWVDHNHRIDTKTVIGALWHPKHKTKNYDIFERLQKILPHDKYSFLTVDGSSDDQSLLMMYNSCHIWLSLSKLEGFHQCPAEAALCGALVVYNDINSGGTRDYCNVWTGTPFYSIQDIVYTIENPQYKLVEKMKKKLYTDIGSREKNMKKFLQLSEQI